MIAMQPLTAEQKELASQNIRLVEWFVKRYPIRNLRISKSEYKSFLYERLCQCCRFYDPTLGNSFSTYCVTSFFRCRIDIYKRFNSGNKNLNNSFYSLDNIMASQPTHLKYNPLAIEDPPEEGEMVEIVETYRKLLQKLIPAQKAALLSSADGIALQDVATALGCSKQNIHNKVKAAIRNMRVMVHGPTVKPKPKKKSVR